MLATLFRCKDGLAVLLTDEDAARLGVTEGSQVEITLAGDRLVPSANPTP